MKAFPYFRWFPADAQTDEFYTSLTDAELGFYHRLLNHSWINCGLPSDMDALARTLRVARPYLDRMWKRVGSRFALTDAVHPRLVNPRQEEEREHAIRKSQANSRPGNASAAKRDGIAIGSRSRFSRDTNGPQRAYGSVSVSDSENLVLEETTSLQQRKTVPMTSEKFHEVWARWPRRTNMDSAAMDWASVVTTENEDAVLACAERYLASDEVSRGAVKNLGSTMDRTGWLIDCSRDGWQCDWPKAREQEAKRGRSFVADVERAMGKNLAETGKPW